MLGKRADGTSHGQIFVLVGSKFPDFASLLQVVFAEVTPKPSMEPTGAPHGQKKPYTTLMSPILTNPFLTQLKPKVLMK